MSGLCLTSGLLAAQVAANSFTLGWTHSIEKILWEEDWRVTPSALVLEEGRVRGSGAGMEPPPGARFEDGVWHYRADRRLPRLTLTHSPWAQGYRLCLAGACRPLAEYLPGLPDVAFIELLPCPTSSPSGGIGSADDRARAGSGW